MDKETNINIDNTTFNHGDSAPAFDDGLFQRCKLTVGKDNWSTNPVKIDGALIPSITFADGPHGLRKEASSKKIGLNPSQMATCFPTSSAVANSWNTDLVERVGKALGTEAAHFGVDVLLGPGINLKRDPRCGRNFEYFTEDPYLSGKLGAAYVRGVQSVGVGACVKHFAANNNENRRMSSNSIVDTRALYELYLTPFEITVKEGAPWAVMSAYNAVNGQFCDQNKFLLTNVLRESFGFQGVVLSDWGGCRYRTLSSKVGSDLQMPAYPYSADTLFCDALTDPVLRDAINNSVDRIKALSDKCNNQIKTNLECNFEAHHALAVEGAKESLVLLKNDILPLSEDTPVALFGEYIYKTKFQGFGSSKVNPYKPLNIADCLGDSSLNVVGIERAYTLRGKKSKTLDKNIALFSSNADTAVIFVGRDEFLDAEGFDRDTLDLDNAQISAYRSIKAAFKHTIVIVFSGGAVSLEPFMDADAIIFAGLLGQGQAEAVISLLEGKFNPSGKLTESFVTSLDALPTANTFLGEPSNVYKESIYVGYRYYEKIKEKPLFPFGFGLSYTKFLYSNAKIVSGGVSFSLKNVGEYDGAEVCQMYVSMPDSNVFRPIKELKGFKKVFLRKGEEQLITINFDDKTFRFFDSQSGGFKTEAGIYKILIGSSSSDIRLSVPHLVKGVAASTNIHRQDIPSYFSGQIKNVSDDEFCKVYGKAFTRDKLNFYKKNRIRADKNTTLLDLRFAPSPLTRAAVKVISGMLNRAKKRNNHKRIAELSLVLNTPLGIALRFAKFSPLKIDGFIKIVNGKTFKGLKKIFKKQKGINKT